MGGVGGVLSFFPAVFLFFSSLGLLSSMGYANKTNQNRAPGDDGRSKKPNLQAADGIWPAYGSGLACSVVSENRRELI